MGFEADRLLRPFVSRHQQWQNCTIELLLKKADFGSIAEANVSMRLSQKRQKQPVRSLEWAVEPSL